MCAQFTVKTSLNDIQEFLGIQVVSDFSDLDSRVVPYTPGYVLVQADSKFSLKKMRFSLLPSWSKEPKVKFATHNARIETISEKPTWKVPFQTQRALIPITRFIEPIYSGEFAGNMVQFHEPMDSVMFAAAIWDSWTNKETGEVTESFAIITEAAPKFVADTGHDRCPFFVAREGVDQWLEPIKKQPGDLIELLNSNRARPQLTARIDRPLRPGWEKRAKL